jgi:FkbM family methyltransferase
MTEKIYNVEYLIRDLDGSRYFIPDFAKHRPACIRMLNGEMHEPETHRIVKKLLEHRPGNIVHAGTFFGDMLPNFSKFCSHTVFAFEPVLESYILAKMTVDYNALENVFLLNAALGRDVGIVKINTGIKQNLHHGGASYIDDHGQIVSQLTIDSFQIKQLSIIQLDVEGFEFNALSGATHSISASKPVIMIEDNNNECAGLLHGLEYEYSGQIPGLKIWCHRESVIDKKFVQDCITQAS